MRGHVYRYGFCSEACLEEVESALLLAIFATESLHGEAQTRLDAAHLFDPDRRACVIDAGTAVGRDLNKLFAGFLAREFGEDSFKVERLLAVSAASPATVAA